MLLDVILQFFVYVMCLIIKIITASIVILLIIRSLVSKFGFFSTYIYVKTLYSITEIFHLLSDGANIAKITPQTINKNKLIISKILLK